MGLRSILKRVTDKFSGEYSAAQADIRPHDPPPAQDSGDVQVTRARLKRPKDAKEAVESAKPTSTAKGS